MSNEIEIGIFMKRVSSLLEQQRKIGPGNAGNAVTFERCSKALIGQIENNMYPYEREPTSPEVYENAIHLVASAIRFATEGDPKYGFYDPEKGLKEYELL